MPPTGRPQLAATLFVALLVISLVASAATVGANTTRTDIDDENELYDSDSVSTYERQGHVTADLEGVDATITVTDSVADLDDDEFYGDLPDKAFAHEWSHTYIVLDTREGLARDYRIHVPDDYLSAVVDSSPSVDGDADVSDASLSPVDDRSATSVRVEVTEPGVVVISVSALATGVGSRVDRQRDRFDNVTGWSPPSLPGMDSETEWQHVSGDRLDAETAVELDAGDDVDRLDVQFLDVDEDDEESWVPVPQSQQRSEDVYLIERNETPVVVTTADAGESPDIRYREASASGGLGGAIEDIRRVPGRINDALPWT